MQGCKCCKYFQDEISLLPCPLRGGFKNEDKLALETSIEQPSRHWTGWKTQDGKTNICWNWNQRCFVSRKIFLISLQLINGTRLSRFVLLKLASGKKVQVWSKIECWDVAKDNSAARLPPWWLGFLSAASDCLSWSVFWRSGARVQRGRYRQPHLLINKLPLSRQLQAGHQPGTSAHTGPAHEDGIMVARSRGRGSLLAGGHGRGREEAHWRPGYWVPALWWHLQDWWPSPALAAPPRDSPRAPRRAAACHWSALRRHGPPAASSAAVIGWLVSAGRDSGWLLSTHPHDSSSLRPAELQPIYFLFLNEQVCVIWVQADTSLACGCGSEQTTIPSPTRYNLK